MFVSQFETVISPSTYSEVHRVCSKSCKLFPFFVFASFSGKTATSLSLLMCSGCSIRLEVSEKYVTNGYTVKHNKRRFKSVGGFLSC